MSLATLTLVATPLMAFLGVLVGHRLTRTGARELDRWRKREETMRLVRWATELGLDLDHRRSLVGVEFLGALVDAPLVDRDDRMLVAAVFDVVARRATMNEPKGPSP